jgi:TonB family protein
MRRISAMAVILAFFSTAALADSLRSDRHFVKIDVQPLSQTSHQYDVKVFDAESRTAVTQLKLVTKGDTPASTETTAGGTRYQVRIEPHGDSYRIDFTAGDGAEGIETMRGGFTAGAKTKQDPAHVARGGRHVKEPAVLRRVEPVYTEEAKAAGAVASVVVEVLIDRSGFVRDATALQSIGLGRSESAVDAVKQWQFEPSMEKGVPVEVAQEVTIDFKP